MDEKNRLVLAEAVGWKLEYHKDARQDMWQSPNGKAWYSDLSQAFDPETDANDCEVLMHWLMADSWHIEITWQADHEPHFAAGAYVHIWQEGTEIHHRTDYDSDRWKEALCALFLKQLATVTDGPR